MPLLLPLVPFLPEIMAAAVAVALIVLAAKIADGLKAQGGGGFLAIITAPITAAADAVESALNWVGTQILDSNAAHLGNLLEGAAQSVQALIDYPAALWKGTHAALVYLWSTAIPGFVKAQLAPVIALGQRALALAQAAEADSASAFDRAVNYVDGKVSSAIATAESYARAQAEAARSAAEAYADTAVAKLRSAEDAALESALSIARQAETDAAGAVKTAESYVDSVTAPIGKEVSDLDAYIRGLGLTALVAAVPALSTLVQTIAAESGLDNAACRSKVKGICGTDPAQWAGLLAGLGLLGFGFTLEEIYKIARPLIAEGASVIRQAA